MGKRDMRLSKKKAPINGGVFAGSLLVFWGAGVACYIWCDLWQSGMYSVMFPVLDETWKEILYMTGVFLMMWIEGVFQTVWWNVLYDNCVDSKKGGPKMGMRLWAAICMAWAVFCYQDPAWYGRYWWSWPCIMAVFKGIMTLASFVLYEKVSFGAAVGLRLGIYTATYLLWLGVYFQWWGLSWTLLQFKSAPGNLMTG